MQTTLNSPMEFSKLKKIINKEFLKMEFTPNPSAQNQKQKTYLSFRIKANLKKKKNFTSHNKAYPVQKFCTL